ncbi:MAG: hypothetical protein WD043_12045 [Gemmatimonadales bacterium]
MRYTTPLLALLLAVVPAVHAQSALVVTAGVERYDQRDALASPLRYGGAAPSLTAAWRRDGRTASGIELTLSRLRLTPNMSGSATHFIDAWAGAFAAHWLRCGAEDGSSALCLGARLDAFLSMRQQTYRPDVPTELYGDLIAGLEAAVAWTWRPAPQHALRQTLSVPVASAAVRTPYTGAKYIPPIALGGPGRLVGLRYEAEYTRAVGRNVALGSRYVFRTFRYPDPRSFKVVSHRLSAVLRVGGTTP